MLGNIKKVALGFALFSLFILVAVVVASMLNNNAPVKDENTIAFGRDVIFSPEDVPDEMRVHDPVPCETAVSLTWYRDHLDSEDKVALYDLINAAILGRRDYVAVPDFTEEETTECFWAVIYDHPEYFWIDKNYLYFKNSTGQVQEFGLNYHIKDKDTIESKWRDYEIITDAVIAGSSLPKTNTNKIRQAYTWICYSTVYEENGRDQDMSSVFEGRSSVCAGYVQAMQFMALRIGVPCVRIAGHSILQDGTVSDGNHTWLAMIPFDTIKYYDITWDDQRGASTLDTYYGLTQSEIEETHVFASDIAPRCNDERDDSVEMMESTYNIETGDHLSIPEPVEFGDWSDMFDFSDSFASAGSIVSANVALLNVVDPETGQQPVELADRLSNLHNALATIGVESSPYGGLLAYVNDESSILKQAEGRFAKIAVRAQVIQGQSALIEHLQLRKYELGTF